MNAVSSAGTAGESSMQAARSVLHPTEVLRAEHEVILNVLQCLEIVAENAARTRVLDVRSAEEILDFLRVFADRCHHGKEEGALFPALGRKGMPTHVGPVAVMLSEHEQGRAEIAGIAGAIAEVETGSVDALDAFVAHARAYVRLLRDHIAKENQVLFPMAESMLRETERAELAAAFSAHEVEDAGPGTHERYLTLANALVARLGVQPSARPAIHASACCGHGSTCG
jgi:hemerythrin-like domain-containing protein